MKNSFFHKIKRIIRGSPTEWKNLPPRMIRPGMSDFSLPNNKITTSKYTIITFLPLNLIEQFSKMANIYFLIVGILQMIPAISVSDGLPTEYTPLVVIVFITAIKDIVEDYQRHKADKFENKTKIGDSYSELLRVGDIIQIQPNQSIPADILLLKQECFVETSQLDGETTLKPKQPIIEEIEYIEAQGPNPYLYQFAGSINGQKPLNEHNLLLRGSSLKSLEPIEAIVIYTGHQTKVMLNSHNPRGKISKMSKLMNKLILYLFIGQWILCFFCALSYLISLIIKQDNLYYLYLNKPNETFLFYFQGFWQSIGNWFLLFVNFVPISLMLTLEMIRLFQAYFIIKDEDMQPNCKVQSSNLNDDLGQIDHIFSDKTGTLTANKMTLKQLYFSNICLNLSNDNIEQLFNEENIFNFIQLIMCVDIKIKNENIMSSSSDEMALINYFIEIGVTITEQKNLYTIKYKEMIFQVTKLFIIPFDSSRKRMSIFVKFNEQIYLISKGADIVMQERAKDDNNKNDNKTTIILDFASSGLRVLLYGWKMLEENEFQQWLQKYQNEQMKIQNSNLEELENQIEQNFQLSCITGVEDIIQEQVADTIIQLSHAHIPVWIITGDSYPTAYGVAKKIGLVTNRDKQIVIQDQDISLIEQQLSDSPRNSNSLVEVCLLILGTSLIKLQQEDKYKLISLATKCQGVLFCRVSPKQKREIVELFKQCFPQLCTLAIGDGANDVNMITEANVGIGVAGIEGLQAARAADYAIPQFKCLYKLLLFYGRECYRRNTQVVTYNFYKNVLYLIPQFWFGFYSQFSGQSIYDFYVFQCYNFMFTSLPIIIYGVFDIKSYEIIPENYCIGQKNGYLNSKIFVISLMEGVYQSLLIFFGTFYLLNQISSQGLEYGLILQGQIVFLICIIVANTKIILLSHEIHLLQIITQVLSYLGYIITLIIFNNVTGYQLFGIIPEILTQLIIYLTTYFVTYLALSFIITMKKYKMIKTTKKVSILGINTSSLLQL